MKSFRRVVLMLGGFTAGAGLVGGFVAGCGGDDNVVNPVDSGGPDRTVPETGVPDMSVPEIAPGDNVAPDVMDSGVGDTNVPVQDGAVIVAFANQVATAVCGRYSACCYGADAAAFDMAGCQASLATSGYFRSNEGILVGPPGTYVFNQAVASACLASINSIDCTANTITSTQELAIIQQCYGAVTGTLPVGSPCQASAECAPGEFCNVPLNDGGATDGGNCSALRGSGGLCFNWGNQDYNTAQEACSYRGIGLSTGLTCEIFDDDAGLMVATPGCVPQQATGTGCNFDVDCTSGLCPQLGQPNNFVCQTAETFATATTCAAFLADGG